MGLLSKVSNYLCSVALAASIYSCKDGKEVHKDVSDSTAIMITGNDGQWAIHDAFKNGNEMLEQYFSRSFRIRNFDSQRMAERQLHDMIKEAARNSKRIIISYSGHGGLKTIDLADGRTIDSMYFPLLNMGGLTMPVKNNTRNNLRIPVRLVNNARPDREINPANYQNLVEKLNELGLPETDLNLEYVQLYNPNDGQLFPQEIALLLRNFHGDIAFITNSCFSGYVNELVRRDDELDALAIASSPYNEMSVFDISGGEPNRGGFYLARALATYFGLRQRNKPINLAAIDVGNDRFINFSRLASLHKLGNSCYNLRDEGFNFQRYSEINDFYF